MLAFSGGGGGAGGWLAGFSGSSFVVSRGTVGSETGCLAAFLARGLYGARFLFGSGFGGRSVGLALIFGSGLDFGLGLGVGSGSNSTSASTSAGEVTLSGFGDDGSVIVGVAGARSSGGDGVAVDVSVSDSCCRGCSSTSGIVAIGTQLAQSICLNNKNKENRLNKKRSLAIA